GWLQDPQRRRLFPAMLATLPLAFPSDIYGALLALPFVTLAATVGFAWTCDTFPRHTRSLSLLVCAATLLGAAAIVTQRTLGATPPRVWRAAQFLEQHDPLGPYDVTAPGRARVQIHGYVSGCPRFSVAPGDRPSITTRMPPPLRGDPATVVVQWIDFGRNFLELPDSEIYWYGRNPRHYHVVIDGQGDVPENAELLYDAEQIQIYKPPQQLDP
ncbi:MAG: hypothetical protein O3B24_08520, partial [Verrucomicrobia bacterium]|nr:hypothetical protein [Verrucomicrobiota bacterium]